MPVACQPGQNRSQLRWLPAILIFALALRLAYQAAMVWYGGSFHNGSDSGKYLDAAHYLLTVGTWPITDRVPLYIYFITGVFKIIGSESLRAVVTVQAFIDTLSVLGIAVAARAFARELVIPAAITAAIIPNFLVHAAYILQENLFLLFFSWGLCALLWAVRSKRTAALLAISGMLFGLSLWTRISLSYFPLFLIPALAIALRLELKHSWAQSIALSLIPPVAMLLVIFPLLIFNYRAYGHFALSSQSGDHMLNWVYACLATPWPCADRLSALAEVRPIVAEYVRSIGGPDTNPFAVSAFQQKLAAQYIVQLPPWQVAWGMIWGAFKNLMQTGFYQVFTQFKQPITFLSAMPGAGILERIPAFISVNKGNVFMMLWAVSQAALVLSRIVQTIGAVVGLQRTQFRAPTILLLVTIVYILVLDGPIADPKYRIPCEPALIILFALGWTYSATLIAWRTRITSWACHNFHR